MFFAVVVLPVACKIALLDGFVQAGKKQVLEHRIVIITTFFRLGIEVFK